MAIARRNDNAKRAYDVDLVQLWHDPYPICEAICRESPVAWVPKTDHYFVMRLADVIHVDANHEIFAASEARSLNHVLMGHNFMRKDGAEHLAERRIVSPSLTAGAAKNVWRAQFEEIATELIDEIAPRGKADLFTDFATPMAARSLCAVTGLTNIAWQDIARWSQAMIDAVQNYGGDPELARLGREATGGIDAAIDERLKELAGKPDRSVLSMMIAGGMPLASMRANLKVMIGGGQNEPRDVNAGVIWSLLSNPDQLAAVRADPSLWQRAFEEYVRWIAPISMYPRTVIRPTTLGGVDLVPGERLALMIGIANRDPTAYVDPHRYNIFRTETRHVGFGSGPHFCAGAWVSRVQVADVAVPMAFERLKGLRLVEDDPVRCGGWVFRGPLNLPVEWDA